MPNKKYLLGLALLVLSILLVSLLYRRGSDSPSPQSFEVDKSLSWQPFGGTWEAMDGVMQNSSEQRGAKLMNGSTNWRNYSVDADVQLLGRNGDAGVILRSSNEEIGVDSYRGYFAGIRNTDDTIVVGRADFDWHEYPAAYIIPHIKVGEWYHLKVLAYDCDIAATAKPSSGHSALVYVRDPDCIRNGRFGLKSYSSGGRWRNIQVRPATHEDLIAMIGNAKPAKAYSGPSSNKFTPKTLNRYMEPVHQEAKNNHFELNIQSIASLHLLAPDKESPVTIHGVITLISPMLYVQDATGGIALPGAYASAPLQIGDQIEAKGNASVQDFGPVLKDATVRALWSDAPVSPLVVTVFQLATGSYNGSTVEVEGLLKEKSFGPDRTIILTLMEGSQSFRAIAFLGSSNPLLQKLEAGSILRLHGVCVVDATYTQNIVPFALLLPSVNDVQLIRRPPWWSTTHIVMVAVGLLLMGVAIQIFLNRIARWRLKAVLDERERLAMEMHDTLAQSFTGIGFQLQAVRDEIRKDDTTQRQLNVALDMVRMSHQEAKRSIASLRPTSLDDTELIDALEASARRLVNGGLVNISSSAHGDKRVIPLRAFDGLFRIGQEAISNAIRHAKPTRILISLFYEKNALRLVIEDDGSGFSTDGQYQGFGIRGIEKRVEGIGGNLQIISTPSNGTSVIVTVPLTPQKPYIHRVLRTLRNS
jgi:signal transduction histidine kinase